MCQNVADFTGFERPTTVIDNTDPIARQLLALANNCKPFKSAANNSKSLQSIIATY